MGAYTTKAVTPELWGDLEALFESPGSPHYCWCMAWRPIDKAVVEAEGRKRGRKLGLLALVKAARPVGLLMYRDDTPIAWCSIAPRETYRRLSGAEADGPVWSLACFFIKRPFRGQGLTSKLLERAVEYARAGGARYVEAYPIRPGTTSYRFMGYMPTFERAGFKFIKPAGTRRNVMLLKLS